MHNINKPEKVDPTAYEPILSTIAKGESGGNYNAYFGNPANSSIRFTDMPVRDVLAWQAEHVGKGNYSSAVGKYQIIGPTLVGLIKQLHVDDNELFDASLQDRMAISLLERRGSIDYVQKKLSREQFAANLAMEWAALPKILGPNPEASYYASDGVNKSHITIDEVFGALAVLQDSASA